LRDGILSSECEGAGSFAKTDGNGGGSIENGSVSEKFLPFELAGRVWGDSDEDLSESSPFDDDLLGEVIGETSGGDGVNFVLMAEK
jgi:hypothetical protein